MDADRQIVRLAASADLHFGRTPEIEAASLLEQMNDSADVLALCGDLTDRGTMDEAKGLAEVMRRFVKSPVVAVLGNHDHESGQADEIGRVLADAGVEILDGSAREIRGVGFAGTKGFGGGFGAHMLNPWGEDRVKQFAAEAVNEALKLETALAHLQGPTRVALLHYAVVEGTVVGEPREIYPFLGCSRLEEALTRYRVTAVFHGHAHKGQLESRTRAGAPVYNVSLQLMRASQPACPFRVLEIPVS